MTMDANFWDGRRWRERSKRHRFHDQRKGKIVIIPRGETKFGSVSRMWPSVVLPDLAPEITKHGRSTCTSESWREYRM
jgi:hypothetical protein